MELGGFQNLYRWSKPQECVGIVLKKSPEPGSFASLIVAEEKVREDLVEGDKKTSISPATIVLSNDNLYIAVGVKNKHRSALSYFINITPISGESILGLEFSNNLQDLYYVRTLAPEEIDIIPGQILVRGSTSPGSAVYRVTVMDITNGKPPVIYDSATFSVTIKRQ